MKKVAKSVILMIIAIILMTITVYAADFSVKMNAKQEEKEVTVQIKLGQNNITGAGINAFICDFEYDRDVFETVKKSDITTQNGWEDLTYNEEKGTLLTLREDFTKIEDEEIVTIKLHQKDNAKAGKTQIKLTGIQASNSQQDLEAEDNVVELKIGGSIILTIVAIIAVIIALLFIAKFLIKSNFKRRKRK